MLANLKIDLHFILFCFFFKKASGALLALIASSLVEGVLTIVLVLISIAAYSLLDRKVMALIQRRKGPNMVGPFGGFQFLVDGLKLFFKEIIVPAKSSRSWFLLAPIASVCISLTGWAVVPLHPTLRFSEMSLDLLVILTLSSLNVYMVILSGWASNSRYAFLGSLRAVAQIISYEIPMLFSLLPVIAFSKSLNISDIVMKQVSLSFMLLFLPSAVIFFICMLAETNRVPFDLAEAESELVAGFNTEYSSVIFAFFFISEYSNMLLFSCLWVNLFWAGWLPPFYIPSYELISFFVYGFKVGVLSLIFVLFRATLPRYRYDQFMDFGWKLLIPLTFCYTVVSLTALVVFN